MRHDLILALALVLSLTFCTRAQQATTAPDAPAAAAGARDADGATADVAGNPVGGPDVRLPEWYEANRVALRVNMFASRISDRPGEWDAGRGTLFHHAGREFAQINARVIQRPLKSGDEGPWWPSMVAADGIRPVNTQWVYARGDFNAGEDLAQKIIDEAGRHDQTIIAYYRHMEEARFGGQWNKRAVEGNANRQFDPAGWTPTPTTREDWLTRDERGRPQVTTRGIWLCANSPYRAVVAQRIAELALKGAGGVHFDFMHNPPGGCFCQNCRNKWTELGMEGEFPTAPGDPRLYDFYCLTLEDYFRSIIASTRRVDPEFVHCMKAATLSSPLFRGVRTSNAAIADVCGLEYAQGVHPRSFQTILYEGKGRDRKRRPLHDPSLSTKWALAWGLVRDASYGRPPKIAVDESQEATADELQLLAAAALTHGCVALIPANLEVPGRAQRPEGAERETRDRGDRGARADRNRGDRGDRGNRDRGERQGRNRDGQRTRDAQGNRNAQAGGGDMVVTDIARYAPAQEMGNVLAPHIAYARPVRWAGILFPETAMAARGWSQDLDRVQTLTVFREVMSPMYAAIELLVAQGAPYGFLAEGQVDEDGAFLASYALVISPVPRAELVALERKGHLPEGFVNTLETGREVIYLDGGVRGGQRWDGHPGEGPDRAALQRGLGEAIRGRALPEPRVRVDLPRYSDDEIHAVPMEKIGGANDDDLIVMLTRRWDWAYGVFASGRMRVPRPTAAEIEGCTIHVRADEPPKKAFVIDLRSGRRTDLEMQRTAGGVSIPVPPFRQATAVVIDADGETR